jgi:hypothetical protein
MPNRKPKTQSSRPHWNPEDWYKNIFDCEVLEETGGYKLRMLIHITKKPPWSKEIEVTSKQVEFLDGKNRKIVSIPECVCRRVGI